MAYLTLYYKPACPYCQKVLAHMDRNGISVPLKNREESPTVREELVKIGGKPQVPCLVVDGKAMYESDDIIQWFKTNWKKS
ncbi:MAG: glutathione S-transferase N-terminal domain-containing protein [Candidatus Omnitrophica bacterium]|nr:glutathione S-transferase N-terminal domain-containing protein [Candidatus Omnitrophota bacterium]